MLTPGADDALDLIDDVLGELAKLAVRTGVPFGRLDHGLKRGVLRAARDASRARQPDVEPSISRLGVLTGLDRREVRRIALDDGASDPRGARSFASILVTRWASAPEWRNERGAPRALPRRIDRDDILDFETLARSVTTDVHPGALLDELSRLGAVEIDPRHDMVALKVPGFVPGGAIEQVVALSCANVADHLAAIRANLAALGEPADGVPATPFVEQAVHADELTEADAAHAAIEATREWLALLAELVPRLEALESADAAAGRAPTHRVRIGMYCQVAPNDAEAEAQGGGDGAGPGA